MSWLPAIYFLLLLLGVPGSTEPSNGEEPGVIIAEEGEPVNVTCRFHHRIDQALCLNRTLRKPMQVLYVAVPEKRKTEAPEYANRTKYFEMNNTVTIMVEQVKPNDSDVYMCKGLLLMDGEPTERSSGSIMLVVKASDNKLRNSSSSLWMLCALIIQSLLLVAVVAYCIFFPKNNKIYCKKNKEKEAQNMVYEDMTHSLRCHQPLPETNHYTV